MQKRTTLALAASAAGVAILAAGCGGSSVKAQGATPDAKAAARTAAKLLEPTTKGIKAVACGPLDYASTYRCTVDTQAGTVLVCSQPGIRTDASGAEIVQTQPPYCLTPAADSDRQHQLNGLVVLALSRLNAGLRLRAIVTGLVKGHFKLGCSVGFRTVESGAKQSSDVVVQLLAVAADSGKTFWTTLIVPESAGTEAHLPITEKSGVDPADKPPVNPYSSCQLDAAGGIVAREEPRDAALVPLAYTPFQPGARAEDIN